MLFIVLFFYFLFVPIVNASVVLNEISPTGDPEWVELYNTGEESVDLSGFTLWDAAGDTADLMLEGTISAKSYLVFPHAKGWLNDSSKETLTLKDKDNQALDSVTYSSCKSGLSIARLPDGIGEWFMDVVATQGLVNLFPSPTPSPSPDLSPTPSPNPSPSSIESAMAMELSPTPTPNPSPSSISHSTPRSSPQSLASPSVEREEEGTVAGDSIEITLDGFGASPLPSPTPSPKGNSSSFSERLFNVIFIGVGLLALSVAGYFGYRKYHHKISGDSPN